MTNESPALTHQSEHYPAPWQGRVPKRVRAACHVLSDWPGSDLRVSKGDECEAYVNSHGAVSAVLEGGRMLGLRPYEFEVIEWH